MIVLERFWRRRKRNPCATPFIPLSTQLPSRGRNPASIPPRAPVHVKCKSVKIDLSLSSTNQRCQSVAALWYSLGDAPVRINVFTGVAFLPSPRILYASYFAAPTTSVLLPYRACTKSIWQILSSSNPLTWFANGVRDMAEG